MTLAEDILDDAIETLRARKADVEQWDLDALKREVDARLRRRRRRHARLQRQDVRRDSRRALGAHRRDVRGQGDSWSAPRCCSASSATSCCRSSIAQWKDHLYSLDHLKEGIGLRGYGQRDPLVEYKKESFALFQAMKDASTRRSSATCGGCGRWSSARTRRRAPARAAPAPLTLNDAEPRGRSRFAFGAAAAAAAGAAAPAARRPAPQPARVGGDDAAVKTVRRDEPKVGRNDPCPCGSGKKYKKCHGAAA